jgi:bifunctional UDP-N-acetylglucosamine pyrophosphorylase/glucosamine-1-phosphate N-acetyltransferase
MVKKIIEHKDADRQTLEIKEVNSGMYIFKIASLVKALKQLKNDNSQGEYYLTDTLEILINDNQKVGAFGIENSEDILGINDRNQLSIASKIIQGRIISNHMKNGVTIIDPASTYIETDVEIGMDTIIYPMTFLENKTVIGQDCVIGPSVRINGSKVDDNVEIINSVILESRVGKNTHVGPFAYIRPGSEIGANVKIGDFVEIKKSHIGDNTKISHLTYVGDASVGKNVNMGCGVVFVNYDGEKKNITLVEDNAFIGCNVNLISPVAVKQGAYIAAGSTITENVPENSLAIARCKQTIKENWVKNKFKKRGK